jgi:hypothetical protein
MLSASSIPLRFETSWPTKLGRNKTDGVDASRIREYCELFKPLSWAPPSEAHHRLGELQTIRSGIIAGLTEWKNRKSSGIVDAEAQALANATILHFTSQIEAVDKAIREFRRFAPPLSVVGSCKARRRNMLT